MGYHPHPQLIYDTPGINGWGRNNSRKDLEERARKAVEVADFVLVCFDSQSQQADEFAKFAAWVSEYRKPVIAVLNPRNAMWRMPGRVSAPMARGKPVAVMRDNDGIEPADLRVPVEKVAGRQEARTFHWQSE
ncbi:GTPase [Pseudomonas fluorescens]|uniref:GTPase n=1 Tax=Pseudomonas fluorescens TaxID=294 RepID=UPI00123F687B